MEQETKRHRTCSPYLDRAAAIKAGHHDGIVPTPSPRQEGHSHRAKAATSPSVATEARPGQSKGEPEEVLRWLSAVHLQLQEWLRTLREWQARHQGVELIPPETALLGLGLYRCFVKARITAKEGFGTSTVAAAALAACLWVAIKFLACACAVPNAQWIAAATGQPMNLVISFEPQVLKAANWDVLGVVKAVGLWPDPPPAKASNPSDLSFDGDLGPSRELFLTPAHECEPARGTKAMLTGTNLGTRAV